MNKILLSVVLPNFNHAQFLPSAIDALLSQDRPPDEICIIDDASKDDSIAIMQRYSNRHPCIRIFRNEENLGALASLQRGVEAALGRYVYLAAADDFVLPGFFRNGLAMFEKYGEVGLVCADAVIRDGHSGQQTGVRPPVRPLKKAGKLDPEGVERLLKRADNFILTGASLIRRDYVLEMDGFDQAAGPFADGLLVRKIALRYGLAYFPLPAVCWNLFPDGYSQTTVRRNDQALKALVSIPAIIAADDTFPKWYPELFRRRWQFAVSRTILEDVNFKFQDILSITANSKVDSFFLKLLRPLTKVKSGRYLCILYLALRLRPYRLSDILSTAIDRYWQRLAASRAFWRTSRATKRDSPA